MAFSEPWICKGYLPKNDPYTGEKRRCRQKLGFFDPDKVNFKGVATLIEIKCNRCHTLNGGSAIA